MRKLGFSEVQIMNILQEAKMGVPISNLLDKYGIDEGVYYKWRKQYEGMNFHEMKRFIQLEEENARLKDMYANLSMQHEILKEVLENKLCVDLEEEI